MTTVEILAVALAVALVVITVLGCLLWAAQQELERERARTARQWARAERWRQRADDEANRAEQAERAAARSWQRAAAWEHAYRTARAAHLRDLGHNTEEILLDSALTPEAVRLLRRMEQQ